MRVETSEDIRKIMIMDLCANVNGTERPSMHTGMVIVDAHFRTCPWCQAYFRQRGESEKHSISDVAREVISDEDENC